MLVRLSLVPNNPSGNENNVLQNDFESSANKCYTDSVKHTDNVNEVGFNIFNQQDKMVAKSLLMQLIAQCFGSLDRRLPHRGNNTTPTSSISQKKTTSRMKSSSVEHSRDSPSPKMATLVEHLANNQEPHSTSAMSTYEDTARATDVSFTPPSINAATTPWKCLVKVPDLGPYIKKTKGTTERKSLHYPPILSDVSTFHKGYTTAPTQPIARSQNSMQEELKSEDIMIVKSDVKSDTSKCDLEQPTLTPPTSTCDLKNEMTVVSSQHTECDQSVASETGLIDSSHTPMPPNSTFVTPERKHKPQRSTSHTNSCSNTNHSFPTGSSLFSKKFRSFTTGVKKTASRVVAGTTAKTASSLCTKAITMTTEVIKKVECTIRESGNHLVHLGAKVKQMVKRRRQSPSESTTEVSPSVLRSPSFCPNPVKPHPHSGTSNASAITHYEADSTSKPSHLMQPTGASGCDSDNDRTNGNGNILISNHKKPPTDLSLHNSVPTSSVISSPVKVPSRDDENRPTVCAGAAGDDPDKNRPHNKSKVPHMYPDAGTQLAARLRLRGVLKVSGRRLDRKKFKSKHGATRGSNDQLSILFALALVSNMLSLKRTPYHLKASPTKICQCGGGRGNTSSQGRKNRSSQHNSRARSRIHVPQGSEGSATGGCSGGAGGDDNGDGKDRDKPKDFPDKEDPNEDEETAQEKDESAAASGHQYSTSNDDEMSSSQASASYQNAELSDCIPPGRDNKLLTTATMIASTESKAGAQHVPSNDNQDRISQAGQNKLASLSLGPTSDHGAKLETLKGKHVPSGIATVNSSKKKHPKNKKHRSHLASSTADTSTHSDTSVPSDLNDNEGYLPGHQVSTAVETETTDGRNAPSTVVCGIGSQASGLNWSSIFGDFTIFHTCPPPPASSEDTPPLPGQQQGLEQPTPLANFNTTMEADPLDLSPIDPIDPYPAPIPEGQQPPDGANDNGDQLNLDHLDLSEDGDGMPGVVKRFYADSP